MPTCSSAVTSSTYSRISMIIKVKKKSIITILLCYPQNTSWFSYFRKMWAPQFNIRKRIWGQSLLLHFTPERTSHFIRYTLLVPSSIPLCLHNCGTDSTFLSILTWQDHTAAADLSPESSKGDRSQRCFKLDVLMVFYTGCTKWLFELLLPSKVREVGNTVDRSQGHLHSHSHLNLTPLWTVGGSCSTHRKPTQTQKNM